MGKSNLNFLLGDRRGEYEDLFEFDRETFFPYLEKAADLLEAVKVIIETPE
jgi:hypothetical protein